MSAWSHLRTIGDTTRKVCRLVTVALQNEPLPLALDGGIQKFFKALVGEL